MAPDPRFDPRQPEPAVRVYQLDHIAALYPGPIPIFRVSSRGRFDRWDAPSRTWVHATDPGLRDFYSRAIENGDAREVPDPSR